MSITVQLQLFQLFKFRISKRKIDSIHLVFRRPWLFADLRLPINIPVFVICKFSPWLSGSDRVFKTDNIYVIRPRFQVKSQKFKININCFGWLKFSSGVHGSNIREGHS